MRLFAALVPPQSALDHLELALAPFWDSSVRWTEPADWHLTLAFFGEVAEHRLPELTARMTRAAARHDQIDVALRGAGRFGQHALWVGCAGETLALRRIAQAVGAAGRRAGADVDERRFRPHVTLARAHRNRPADLRGYVSALAQYSGPRWPGKEIELIESHLGAGRPRYETLARCLLRGGRASG